MAQIVIPPWLNTNPAESVTQMLHGYGLGLQASEAQAVNAARAQQQALAQQQAAELNAYRQQEQALAERRFTEELRLQQEKAARDAQEAAMQLEGMQTLERRTAAGEPFEKVWPDVAPKVLYRHPQSLAQSMESVLPPRPPVYGTTPEGLPFAQGKDIHYAPASSLQDAFEPEIIDMGGGLKAVRLSPHHIQIIEKPAAEGSMSMLARSRLADIRAEEKALNAEVVSRKDPRFQEKQDTLDELKDERKSIYNGSWKPPPPLARTAPAGVMPLPATKEQLVTGQMYQTSRGPATWDGAKFVQ